MYKKIFSAILFGVLTIASTSTFVSCKDYDDDITNLQRQIDELVNTKVATINTTLTTLQTNLTAIENAYKEGDKETLAAAKALIESAIADLKTAHDKDVATLTAKDAELDAAIVKANQRIDDIVKLLSDQDGNIQQVGKDLKALSDKLANFESQYGTLSTAFGDLTQRVTNLEDALKAQNAKIAALADQIAKGSDGDGYNDAELQSKIEAAGDKIKALEKKISDLSTELNKKIDDKIAEVNKAIEGINVEISELKDAYSKCATKVELGELEEKVNGVRTYAEGVASDLGKLDVMFNILVSDLRSLVFMPKLYIDGIETIEYPYLRYALLHKTDTRAYTRYENDLTAPRAPQNLGGEIYDLIDKDLKDSISYGPAWPIQYHMNPANAQVEFSDIQGYYAWVSEVNTTRSVNPFWQTETNHAADWGMVPADRWDNWYDEEDIFYSTKGGILNVGLKLGDKVANADDPKYIYFPSDIAENGKSPYSVHNIVLALQAKSSYVNKQDTTITSDYAQLLPEKVKIEGLIWYKGKTPAYWDNDNDRIKDFWENKKGYGPATALAAGTVPPPPTYQHNPAGWDYGYRKGLQNTTMGRDTLCPVTAEWIHVWETPEDALMHPADIELYINKPISLVEHLGVHWYFEQNPPITDNVARNKGMKTWYYNDKDLQRYGFVWVFDTLDYFVDTNQTHDSRYITVNDHKTGLIEAQNVRESGATYEDNTHTAVGREPLVRVRLYHFSNIKDMNVWKNIESVGINKFNADNISSDKNSKYAPVLDGYIRVHITRPELLEIDKFKFNDLTFDLCNDAQTNMTTWAQFSKWVLTDALDNMEKEQFDALYNVEQEGTVDDVTKTMELVQYTKPRQPLALDDKYYTYKKLTAAPATWIPNKDNKDDYKIGKIYTRYDEVGTTNHIYYWRITAEEMEALTHCATATTADKGSNPITIERYIHYTGHFYSSTDPNNAGAKYDDIFIKLSVTIKRADVPVSETKTVDENNWYNWEGSWLPYFKQPGDDRLQSIANNTPYPQDGLGNTSRTVPWRNNMLYTWDSDKVVVSNSGDSKFYFAPFEYEITAQNGTTYIITPRRGNGDNIFDKLICKYWNESHVYQLDKTNPFNSAKLLENNVTLNSCAIRYQADVDGVFKAYGMTVAKVDNPSAWPKADGVFSNDTLYAIEKSAYNSAKEYEPIAIIETNETSLVTKDDYDLDGQTTGATNKEFYVREGAGKVILLHEYVENKWLNSDDQPSKSAYKQADEWDKENAYSEACVNAVGYILDEIGKDDEGHMTGEFKDKGNPLNKQLRGYVGIIATQKCNIANQMKGNYGHQHKPNNFTVFQMTWERPVNMLNEFDFMVDAINNSDFIYIVDIIKLFDWRGASNKSDDGGFDTGYMWGPTGIPANWTNRNWRPNQWLWAYYNVREIKVDLRTSVVLTDHSHPGDFKPISDPTNANAIQLTARGLRSLVSFKYPDFGASLNFPLRTSPQDYNAVSENDKLIEYMGLDNPRQETLDTEKARFGYIRYENNGQNVHDFDVKLPISIVYDWGELRPGWAYDASNPTRNYITIHIKHTRAND